MDEKKIGEGKGGKYSFSGGEEEKRRKRRKYLVSGGEKERRRKRENIFGQAKCLVRGGEEK